MKALFSFFLFITISGTGAQAPSKAKKVNPVDDLIEQMRQGIKRDKVEFDRYLNSGFLSNIDKFFADSKDQLSNDPEFLRMVEELKSSLNGLSKGLTNGIRTEWREERIGRVYVIHANLSDNSKFDLDISDKKVKVSGVFKRSTGSSEIKRTLKRSFPVPPDVDEEKVYVKKGDSQKLNKQRGQLWVVFPWKKGKGLKTTPVKKSSRDKTI